MAAVPANPELKVSIVRLSGMAVEAKLRIEENRTVHATSR